MRKVLTKEIKNDVCDFYLSYPMSLSTLSNHSNLSLPTVAKILDEYGIKRYKKAQIYNPNMIENYFEEINEQNKAYFLGLIVTDGNVFKCKTKQASVSITLQEGDSYLLQKFKDEVAANTSIASDGRGASTIAVRSDTMANDLKKYGIVERKSLITSIPSIARKYHPHLIRGILDGDGCVQAREMNNHRYKHSVGFCGTKTLMEQLRNIFIDELNVTPVNVYNFKNKQLSMVTWSSLKDIQTIYHYLYDDAIICMVRKREKFEEILEYFHLN